VQSRERAKLAAFETERLREDARHIGFAVKVMDLPIKDGSA